MSTPPSSDDPRPPAGPPDDAGEQRRARPWPPSPEERQEGQPLGSPPPGQHPAAGAPWHPPQQPQWGGQQPWGRPQPWPGGPGQYGPPSGQQWTPGSAPAALPPDRTRRRLLIALVVLSVAIAAAVAGLVYVLSFTTLNPSRVERDVAALFEERHQIELDLSCPDDMKVVSGEVYRCSGSTPQGEQVEIEIRIDDSLDGTYSWVEVQP
jgi:hypothetical protein